MQYSPSRTGRLVDLAYGRAGDKGNIANVSVIARRPEYYPQIKALVTPERLAQHLGPLAPGRIDVFALDSICALNVVMHHALDGGATRSLRIDALGKSLAGAVLYLPLDSAI